MSKRPSGSSAAAQKKKMLTRDRFKYRLMRVNPTDFDVEELSAAQLVAFEQRHPQIAARWINGEDAAPSWQQSCGSILKGLMATKTAAPFNTPVDPVALNLPDYFTIVENPMDFGARARAHRSDLALFPSSPLPAARADQSASSPSPPPAPRHRAAAPVGRQVRLGRRLQGGGAPDAEQRDALQPARRGGSAGRGCP